MFPFTLGANIGTTVTGILAAAVASTSDSMQVALAHLFFNLSGIIIWYPLPFMRRIPIAGAKILGTATRWWRGFPILYIAVAFFLIPLILFGISSLFNDTSKKGNVTFGSMIVVFVALGLAKFTWFWYKEDGAAITKARFEHWQKKKDVHREVVDEFRPLKEDVQKLKEHTGLSGDEGADVEKATDSERTNRTKNIESENIESERSATSMSNDFDKTRPPTLMNASHIST
jgi:sodium-dependent phosphate cotransporter